MAKKSTPTEANSLTPEAAEATLAADRERRLKQCGEELNALLARHRCKLDTVQEWRGGIPQPIAIVIIPE